VLLGLVATIIVRANLLMLPIGIASVPLGFGVVYGTLRSLFERPLRDRLWEVNFGEADGRLQWALAKVDADGTSLTFERVSKAVADYRIVRNRTDRSGSSARSSQRHYDCRKRAQRSGASEVPRDVYGRQRLYRSGISPIGSAKISRSQSLAKSQALTVGAVVGRGCG
jgi:hypothetical protein